MAFPIPVHQFSLSDLSAEVMGNLRKKQEAVIGCSSLICAEIPVMGPHLLLSPTQNADSYIQYPKGLGNWCT